MRNSQQFTPEMPSDPPFYENEEVLDRILNKALYDYRHAPDLRDKFIECSSTTFRATRLSVSC